MVVYFNPYGILNWVIDNSPYQLGLPIGDLYMSLATSRGNQLVA